MRDAPPRAHLAPLDGSCPPPQYVPVTIEVAGTQGAQPAQSPFTAGVSHAAVLNAVQIRRPAYVCAPHV